MKLSVCMIVKDEEKMLPRCLASVSWADEIIVIDTGSTDRTIEIAQRAGAMVFTQPWSGSFAAARNESLRHASGDWILILDADEGLVPDAEPQIRALMGVDECEGYAVRIRNYLGDGRGGDMDASEHYHVRLFRNKPHYQFYGVIHEQLVSTDPSQPFDAMRYPGLLILHDGYRSDVFEAKGKQARNAALLQAALKSEPDNPYHHFNWAQSQWADGHNTSALAHLMTCMALCGDSEPVYLPCVWINAICITQALHGPDTAWELLHEAPAICQANPDYWAARASIALERLDFTDAVQSFERAACMDTPGFECDSSFDRSNMTWKPYAGIARAYLLRGYPEVAVLYLQKSLERCPDNPLVRQELAQIGDRLPWLVAA